MPTHRQDPTLLKRVGRRLRAARERIGLSQADVAERISIEPETLSRYEGGKGSASLTTLNLAARALGVTLVDLVAEDDLPPSAEPTIDRVVATLRGLDEHHRGIAVEVVDAIAKRTREDEGR